MVKVVFTIFSYAYFIHFKLKIQKQNYLLMATFGTSNMPNVHSSLSSDFINSNRHRFASLLIISHHFLSKNQNLNLHFLLLTWDLQGQRYHHFHLLPSSIVVSWDSFSQCFGKKFLNLFFSTHFFIIFMQKPLCLVPRKNFILWTLILQDLSFFLLTIS